MLYILIKKSRVVVYTSKSGVLNLTQCKISITKGYTSMALTLKDYTTHIDDENTLEEFLNQLDVEVDIIKDRIDTDVKNYIEQNYSALEVSYTLNHSKSWFAGRYPSIYLTLSHEEAPYPLEIRVSDGHSNNKGSTRYTFFEFLEYYDYEIKSIYKDIDEWIDELNLTSIAESTLTESSSNKITVSYKDFYDFILNNHKEIIDKYNIDVDEDVVETLFKHPKDLVEFMLHKYIGETLESYMNSGNKMLLHKYFEVLLDTVKRKGLILKGRREGTSPYSDLECIFAHSYHVYNSIIASFLGFSFYVVKNEPYMLNMSYLKEYLIEDTLKNSTKDVVEVLDLDKLELTSYQKIGGRAPYEIKTVFYTTLDNIDPAELQKRMHNSSILRTHNFNLEDNEVYLGYKEDSLDAVLPIERIPL